MEEVIIRQKYEAMLLDLEKDREEYSAKLKSLLKLKEVIEADDDPDKLKKLEKRIKWHQTMLKEVKTAIGNIEKCLKKGQPPWKS